MQAVPKPVSKRSKPDDDPLARVYLDRVAKAGCVMCRWLGKGPVPAGIHHAREDMGLGQRASHYLAIGLCWNHHQGPDGWHCLGKRGFYQRFRLDEMDLLSMTIEGVWRHELIRF